MSHNYHRMCGCSACCLIEEAEEREEEEFEASAAELARLPKFRLGCEDDDAAEQSAKEEIEWQAEFHHISRFEAATKLLRTYA